MGRNCASQESVGFGRRLAVVSSAWFCRIVERAASKAWLCCTARRSASSIVMRADGGAPGAGRGGIAGTEVELFSLTGAGGFCCARTKAGTAKTARPNTNEILKWYSSRVPKQTGQLATEKGNQPGINGLVRGREARAARLRGEKRRNLQAPAKSLPAGSPRESGQGSATAS